VRRQGLFFYGKVDDKKDNNINNRLAFLVFTTESGYALAYVCGKGA